MTIIDEPLDIETDWPQAMPREQARLMLESWAARGVISPAYAQELWDDVLGPLYDSRAATAKYPRGRCSCGAVHPSWRFPDYTGKKIQHLMRCRNYVGPLEHRRVQALNGSFAITGEAMSECSCGKRYLFWEDDEETRQAACPDILFIWRGPRPPSQEESVTKKQNKDEAKTNQQVQEEQGLQSPSQTAVQAEQARLEGLAAQGQVGPDQRDNADQQVHDEDHQPGDQPTADRQDADDEKGEKGQSYNR